MKAVRRGDIEKIIAGVQKAMKKKDEFKDPRGFVAGRRIIRLSEARSMKTGKFGRYWRVRQNG